VPGPVRIGRQVEEGHDAQGFEVAPERTRRIREGRLPDEGDVPAGAIPKVGGRRGHARATVAVGHSILIAAYHILDRGVPYDDLGGDWFIRRKSPERHARKLVAQLEALGFKVDLENAA
jgi:hypothetical protein